MLRLIAPPTDDVVTLAEAKAHLRVDEDDEDDLIEALTAAAVARLDGADGMLGRCLAPQTWQLALPAFPAGGIRLPLPPTIAVTSLAYLDTTGTLVTLDPAAYRVVDGGRDGHLVLPPLSTSWDYATAAETPDAVRVTFRAGYQTDDSPPALAVPKPIRQAVLLTLADWYDNRGSAVVGVGVAALPVAADHLVAQFRIGWMG